MAFPRELLAGVNIKLPSLELKRATEKPAQQKFTSSELTRMSIVVPDELSVDTPVETPAGTWSIEEGITVFDFKSEAELARIRIPERRDRVLQRARSVARVVFQMG